MSTLTNRQINIRFLAVTIVVIMMAMYVAKNQAKPEVKVAAADQRVLDCLPEDQGVRTEIWLESTGQGLTMHCDKHEVVGYGSVAKNPAYKMSFLVPVSVD